MKRLLKKLAPLILLGVVAAAGTSLLFGDGCGPVERGVRAALGTWDMWETRMVSPYEAPLAMPPSGTVRLGESAGAFERARARYEEISSRELNAGAAKTYRVYCGHCHGPAGDNRTIVGESFGFALPDLRDEHIQKLSDREMFERLTRGSEKMIPLADTLTPLKRLLAIRHVRTLKGRKSAPPFPPRWVEPAEQPGGPPRD
jgi:hypothetical protein